MLNRINLYVSDYLSKTISKARFVEYMQGIYQEAVASKQTSFELDKVTIIPYIHTVAYWKWSDDELYKEVKRFQSILAGDVDYNYSSFVKLISCNSADTNGLDDDSINIEMISAKFSKSIDAPKTIGDLVHNSVYELVSKANFICLEDSELVFVNCTEDVDLSQINYTLRRLLSYYNGDRAFYFQVSYSVKSGYIYTII